MEAIEVSRAKFWTSALCLKVKDACSAGLSMALLCVEANFLKGICLPNGSCGFCCFVCDSSHGVGLFLMMSHPGSCSSILKNFHGPYIFLARAGMGGSKVSLM